MWWWVCDNCTHLYWLLKETWGVHVVYVDIQQSTNPPAAPPSTQPVVYAEVKQSTNPPAAPPPTQEVLYSEVKDFIILNVVTV